MKTSTYKVRKMPIDEVVDRIVYLNRGLSEFWSNAEGWAPIEAAHLLSESRLDWQVSLSSCLRLWISEDSPEQESGGLILAWVNLGSLVEGTMKLFLSVYYQDYVKDVEAIRRKGQLQAPDCLMLETMRQFFARRIWDKKWDSWIHLIQVRRNAIHAYANRNIGSREEFLGAVRKYLEFLRYLNGRLPYPDDVYEPREF